MTNIYRISVWCALLALAVFVEMSGVIRISGVTPNLYLGFLVALVADQVSFSSILALCAVTGLAAVITEPFWYSSFLIYACIVPLLTFIRSRFTGNSVVDLVILLGVSELAYYVTSFVFQSVFPGWTVAVGEYVYTLLIVVPLFMYFKNNR